MRKCHLEDYLDYEEGKLVRVIEASNEKNKFILDVYKEYSDGLAVSRNLYFRNMCGWCVAVPGEKFSNSGYYGYNPEPAELEPWTDTEPLNLFSCTLTVFDFEHLEKWVPEFYNYVVKKWNSAVHGITIKELVTAYKLWQQYPQIELLLSLGFVKVAFNKSFYKLTESKRKQVQKWIFKNQDKKDYTLSQVQERIKYNMSDSEYSELCLFRSKTSSATNYEVWKYLVKQNKANCEGLAIWKDYNILLKACDHNRKDNYWKWPSDLQSKHDFLLEELESITKAKNKIQRDKDNVAYYEVIKNWLHNNSVINGYEVYIPETIDDWEKQAELLHQCIVRCKYYQKLEKGKFYFLVFIRQNGKPIATAEIKNKQLSIGQFYGNEIDRNNCKPSEEVKKVLDKWLENFTFEVAA